MSGYVSRSPSGLTPLSASAPAVLPSGTKAFLKIAGSGISCCCAVLSSLLLLFPLPLLVMLVLLLLLLPPPPMMKPVLALFRALLVGDLGLLGDAYEYDGRRHSCGSTSAVAWNPGNLPRTRWKRDIQLGI